MKTEHEPTSHVAMREPEAAQVGASAERADARVTAMEEVISGVLRYGVLISFAIVLVGSVLFFVTGSAGYAGIHAHGSGSLHSATSYTTSSQGLRWPTTPGEVLSGLAHGRPYAVIALGLLVLIATPVLRVAASVVTFLWENDRTYAVITAYVLAVLLVSFVIGKGG
jgi:uncharacterized membrane protein